MTIVDTREIALKRNGLLRTPWSDDIFLLKCSLPQTTVLYYDALHCGAYCILPAQHLYTGYPRLTLWHRTSTACMYICMGSTPLYLLFHLSTMGNGEQNLFDSLSVLIPPPITWCASWSFCCGCINVVEINI